MIHWHAGLARNPALPPQLLSRLVNAGDERIDAELVERADITSEHAQKLAGRSPYTDALLVARGLLSATNVDSQQPAVMFALSERGDRTVLRLLAGHPDLEVVGEVALSPCLSPDLAAELAGHPHMAVRRALAANACTPSEVLEHLAKGVAPAALRCPGCDDSPYCCEECRTQHWWCEDAGHQSAVTGMRVALAANPSTPVTAIIGWADDPYMFLREAVAARTGLPIEVYQRLATDPVPLVRCAIASNPDIGEDLIRGLSADTTNDVQRTLAHNPSIPLDVLAKLAPAVKIGPALLPRVASATLQEMEWLISSNVPQVRMLLAERRDLPDDILQRLFADNDAIVLKSLAPNPALTPAQLHSIVDRFGTQVAARVAMNPSCSPDLLLRMASLSPQARKSLRYIASHLNSSAEALALCLWEPRARQVAAAHPALAVDVLRSLLDDPDWQVVEAAAANPALPVPLMENLLDSHLGQQTAMGDDASIMAAERA